jgi:hypothetical protein
LLTFAHLLANQSANYRRQGRRPEGGPHRRVTLQPSHRGARRSVARSCPALRPRVSLGLPGVRKARR